MAATIWKFSLLIDDDVTIRMPAGARLLCVQMQGGVPCLWATVAPDADMVERRFHWRGTGHPLRTVGPYVGTVQTQGLVFHLFESNHRDAPEETPAP